MVTEEDLKGILFLEFERWMKANSGLGAAIIGMVSRAAEEEREACAKVVESYIADKTPTGDAVDFWASRIAAAIRKRGEK